MVGCDTLGKVVHLFPRAAVTEYHTLGGLTQKCIVSQFWGTEV